ncbi:MarR family winged helix-turn-helix transcriptional regulator [Pedobacter aquatilis]|uniref:MarR family winged helix-turn-helix transcriptional regulator n=1 Tax=Pedobacter aquatilis TaxID=351343 RepID=UPI00292DE309|nr:MarR family transcriptional regulator [Pedobacter aquatilis]
MIKSTKTTVEPVESIENKIVDALDKLSQVMRTLAWKTAVEQSISPIQLQVLTFLLNHSTELARINRLAKEFNISKASISDTVKLLEQKKLVEKVYSPTVGRQFIIQLTTEGYKKAQEASFYKYPLLQPLFTLMAEDKEKLFFTLSQVIFALHQSELIMGQRMCQTCKHYRPERERHYCNLLQQYMSLSQLQIDCNEHLIN